MNKKELREHFSKDFIKVKTAILDVIQTSRNVSNKIATSLAQEDFSSIEEYTLLSKNIIDATKQFNELYANAPKILSSIEKEVKEEKKKINLDDLMKDSEEDEENEKVS
jgi:hypothetical protein